MLGKRFQVIDNSIILKARLLLPREYVVRIVSGNDEPLEWAGSDGYDLTVA